MLSTNNKVIRSSQFWDVKSPPVKKHVVVGQLVPTVRGALGLHRPKRLVIDIEGGSSSSEDTLQADDKVIVRILKPKVDRGKIWSPTSRDDDTSLNEGNIERESQYEGWIEYRHYTLDEIEKEDTPNDKTWAAVMGRTSTREAREFHFESADQGVYFCSRKTCNRAV